MGERKRGKNGGKEECDSDGMLADMDKNVRRALPFLGVFLVGFLLGAFSMSPLLAAALPSQVELLSMRPDSEFRAAMRSGMGMASFGVCVLLILRSKGRTAVSSMVFVVSVAVTATLSVVYVVLKFKTEAMTLENGNGGVFYEALPFFLGPLLSGLLPAAIHRAVATDAGSQDA